jgi:hypothetical protein
MSVKNDITYEYRVFTNRLVDVDSMEVGTCTSKSIKKLEDKDKVNGRFFHTSDTDKWYFCWNGKLQELNLKGDADVTAALEEVKTLINKADAAVKNAEATAKVAKSAAAEATAAAKDASDAVESIEGKADKSEVVAELAKKQNVIDDIEDIRSKANSALQSIPEDYITSEELDSKGYLTEHQDISGKQDVITDLATIRSNAELAKSALQSIPEEYATKTYVTEQIEGISIPTVPTNVSEFINDAGYLSKEEADSLYAALGSTGSGDGVSQEYVDNELAKKQDKIDDIDAIRTNANLATTALQSVPAEYVTEDELNGKGFATLTQVDAKQDKIDNLEDIIAGAEKGATALQAGDLEEYLTEETLSNSNVILEINSKIAEINTLLGDAETLTNTILNA